MFHADDEVTGAGSDVHGAANSSRALRSRNFPVGKIAFFGNLQAAHHAEVEMATAGHHVRVSLREKTGTRKQRNRNFHGVHQVGIFFARSRTRSHAENSVLTVKVDSDIRGNVGGNEVGNSPAKIDTGSIGQLLRCPMSDLFASKTWFGHERNVFA